MIQMRLKYHKMLNLLYFHFIALCLSDSGLQAFVAYNTQVRVRAGCQCMTKYLSLSAIECVAANVRGQQHGKCFVTILTLEYS